jgi:Cu2+-exporting ATPase
VVAGSQNLAATVTVRVETVGEQTRFAQIVALMEGASTTKPAFALMADRLAKPFLIAVLIAAFAAGAWWWSVNPEHALMVAVAVLVVTCPCALSLATPAAMLASAGALAQSGVLVRRLPALESLAVVDTFVFDKTGTLTLDAMALMDVQVREGVSPEEALQMAGALAQHSRHPVSRALHKAALPGSWVCDGIQEEAGAGISGSVHHQFPDGRVEQKMLRLGSSGFAGAPATKDDHGVRLYAYLSDASGWLATFSLAEELRPRARQAIESLRASGVDVHVLSGDEPRSVARVAAALGIAHARGGCSPSEKLAALRALQRAGHTVAMVGDGLNDAPVLAGADVSFAFGNLVPLTQARSDFVVPGGGLMSVLDAQTRARRTMTVVRQNLWWAMLYNAACVPLAISGRLPAWLAGLGMAASSLIVVCNALRLNARS